MKDFVTDTHGLIWYLEDSPRLGPAAKDIFLACDRGDLFVYYPTICLVETVYLHERGRIPNDLISRLESELHRGENGLILADLTEEIALLDSDVPRKEIPDMPDGIIAATARHLDLPLISRDRKIQLT
jgi:PIN domain nuclease of toxin-antitoxin system